MSSFILKYPHQRTKWGYNGNIWQGVACYENPTKYGLVGNCSNPANQCCGNRAAILEKGKETVISRLRSNGSWGAVWAWLCSLGGGGPHSFEGLGVLHLRMYEKNTSVKFKDRLGSVLLQIWLAVMSSF